MAVATYRLRVNWTYSKNNEINAATSAINSALVGAGRSEQVTRDGLNLDLLIEPLDEAEATSLRDLLTSKWATGTRTEGKASVVRRDEGSQ